MKPATLESYRERILRVLVHIQHHLDEPLELEALAGVAAFSPYHFHRIFRGMVGESVKEHVRRLRLERAAMRLKSSDRTITQIALDAGFATHEAFTRAFRARFDDSPSGFRARRHVPPPAPAPSGVAYHPSGNAAAFRPHRSPGPELRVEIHRIEPMRVAFLRHVGRYDACGPVWDRLLTWAGSEGLVGAGTLVLGLGHDDPEVTPAEKVRYDACITVDDAFHPRGEIGVQNVAGGEYARTTHHGPYDGLGRTYTRLLGEWLPRAGRYPRSAPCVEVYLNGPESTEPDELLTDVYLPLETAT